MDKVYRDKPRRDGVIQTYANNVGCFTCTVIIK
jgi:hypothetical protein